MKINLSENSLRQALMLFPFIIATGILGQFCNVNSIFQTSTSTPIMIPTLPATPTLSPLQFSTETFTPIPTQTPTFESSALQLQAVLMAVVTQLGPCPRSAGTSGIPEVRIEHKLKGLSASIDCAMPNDAAFSVLISSPDREAILANQLTAEQHNQGEKCFHGYILYEEFSTNPHRRGAMVEVHEWRTQRWIVTVRAFFLAGWSHHEAQKVSETVYASGVSQGLFPPGTCP